MADSKDWVGRFVSKKPEKCPLCGGRIVDGMYVGMRPDGTIYCEACLCTHVLRAIGDMNTQGLYI